MSQSRRSFRTPILKFMAFVLGGTIMLGVAFLLLSIQLHKDEARAFPAQVVPIAENELDPSVWGVNFPREYDSFMKTKDDTIVTPYGGSVPFNKLERVPAMVRIWAGYAFSVDYNKARG